MPDNQKSKGLRESDSKVKDYLESALAAAERRYNARKGV